MIHKASPILLAALLCLLSTTTSATDELIPEIDLLEFLGTIAGLEGMGVEIDLLLEGSLSEGDETMSDGENDG